MEVLSYNRFSSSFKRFVAFVIDDLIIRMGIMILFGVFADYELFDVHYLFNPNTVIIELIMIAYFVACESSPWQGTLGKKVLGMKVVDESFGRISAKTALLRYLTKYLSTFVLGLGFIWIIFDSKKQGWHDKLAKTFVIDN